jgi:hypothetical protein
MNGVNELAGNASSAPVELNQSQLNEQIEILNETLSQHRVLMQKAKTTHENNLTRATDLRKTLLALEQQNTYSNYEKLMDEEHRIMNRIQGLAAKLQGSSRKAVGSR